MRCTARRLQWAQAVCHHWPCGIACIGRHCQGLTVTTSVLPSITSSAAKTRAVSPIGRWCQGPSTLWQIAILQQEFLSEAGCGGCGH